MKDYEVTCSSSPDNSAKVFMNGGVLNDFDLSVFLSILKQYDFENPSNGQLDLSYNFMSYNDTYDNGFKRSKYLNSVKKLSNTYMSFDINHLRDNSSNQITSSGFSYSFNGNLISFERLSVKYITRLRVHLSPPLIAMLKANSNYSLINWKVLSSLSNSRSRLLYFYFCINIKFSRYFTNLSTDKLVTDLYISSCSQATYRGRRRIIRRLLHYLIDNQLELIDFDVRPIFGSSKILIRVQVRRSKLILLG
uniref:Uncharacterized protein n=1 Tax=Melanthalia intermedia TaxID=172989 RepID=A0A345UB27_9FLOR|nr:hypothetical protein [Melanthalia intermedia]AXI97663.1 hypothetical protein [Melanthalia intermedia]